MSFSEKIYAQSPLWLQNLVVSAYGYQWKKRRMGGVFGKEYPQAKLRENYSVDEWKNFQTEHLQKLLLHAFEQVPYYRQSFTAKGFDERLLKKISIDDLHKLPALTKEDLRRYGTTTLLGQNKQKGGAFFSSSGSTGTPVKIYYSHAMHQRWFALFEQRVRNWAGVSSLQPRGMIGGRRVLPGAENRPPFYRYNHFEKQVYFSAYHISKRNAENYLQGINRYNVEYMTGYAMSNFFLADFFQELNLQAPELKAVITSSEKLTDSMREMFKNVYGCKTYDGWSGVEACGLITECEKGSLHISSDAGIIEVLDDNMAPVNAGEAGKVYCTGIINFDQPLIRYAIGDEIILSDIMCSCGRNMPVVKEIMGRIEDVITGKDGRKMVRFHSVFNGLKSVKQAQVIQESEDNIKIKVVTDNGLLQNDEQYIRDRIKSQLGEMNIIIEELTEISVNSNGKFQAVISNSFRKS